MSLVYPTLCHHHMIIPQQTSWNVTQSSDSQRLMSLLCLFVLCVVAAVVVVLVDYVVDDSQSHY